jgi:hypothetical protein
MARLLAMVAVLAIWSGALAALLALVILTLVRVLLPQWAILLVLALAIASGNLPLAFLMVLVLGSVLAGRLA